jgi:peptidoglycan hydrolase-like protein with peptidoglycan-binding domain
MAMAGPNSIDNPRSEAFAAPNPAPDPGRAEAAIRRPSTAPIDPEPAADTLWSVRRMPDRSRLFGGAVLVCFVLSIVLALAMRGFVQQTQRDLAAEIAPLAEGSDRVTALSWSSDGEQNLFIGTALGNVYRSNSSSGTQLLPDAAAGPIVAIVPVTSPTNKVVRTVWLDPTTAGNATPYRVGDKPAVAGLAILSGETLQAVDVTPPRPVVPDPSPLAQVASAPADPQPRATDRKSKAALSSRPAPDLHQPVAPSSDEELITAVGLISTLEPMTSRPDDTMLPDAATVSHAAVFGYRDGSVRMVNSADMRQIFVLRADSAPNSGGRSIVAVASRHSYPDRSQAFGPLNSSPDGALTATASANGEVKIFRAPVGGEAPRVERIEIEGGGAALRPGLNGLSLSSDGRMLLMFGPGGIALANLTRATDGPTPTLIRFDPEAGSLRRLGERGDYLRSVQQALKSSGFDPGPIDGTPGVATRGALADYKGSRSLPSDSAAVCALISDCPSQRISAAALSPNGDMVALAGSDGFIRVLSLPADLHALFDAEPLVIRGHGNVITHLAISPDGGLLASAGIDGRLWITDIARLRKMARWPLADLAAGPMPAAEMLPVPKAAPLPQNEIRPSDQNRVDVAQALNDTIDQIGRLMASASLGCSGGANGVPPANWSSLQSHGNAALIALGAARTAWVSGQNANAVQQINSAQGELKAFVNGLAKSCPGGGSGFDPPSYSAYVATKASVDRSLDAAKLLLGG